MALLAPTPAALRSAARLWVRPRPSLHLAGLGAALLVAVLLRLLWIVRANTYPAPLMDQGFYDEVARRLAEGLGYTTGDGTPTATFPPGYPLLLAAAYRLFGADLAVAQTLNVAIAAGIVLATYTLGRIFAGRGVGLCAAWLIALLPSQVLWTALVMSELLFTLALLASIGLFVGAWPSPRLRRTLPLFKGRAGALGPGRLRSRCDAASTLSATGTPPNRVSPLLHHRRGRGEPLRAIGTPPNRVSPSPSIGGGAATEGSGVGAFPLLLAGLLGGFAALTRGQAVGLPLVLLVWALWLHRPGAVRNTALYTATFVLMLLPWVVRNTIQIDRSVLLASNAGWNAVIGHHDQADGGFWSPLYGHAFDPYLFLPPVEREVAMHEQGLRMAREWAVRHPRREAELALHKVRRLWTPAADAVRWQESPGVRPFLRPWERTGLRWIEQGGYVALLLLAAPAALVRLRRREPLAVLVVVLALYWTMFHVLFFAEGRYLFPLLPLFCLLAAGTLCRTCFAIRMRRHRFARDQHPVAHPRPGQARR